MTLLNEYELSVHVTVVRGCVFLLTGLDVHFLGRDQSLESQLSALPSEARIRAQ